MKVMITPFQMRPGTYSVALGGDAGGVFGSGGDWIFSNPLGSFSIREEWGPGNEFGDTGWVNLRHAGTRINRPLSPAGTQSRERK